ncbi:MAG TPA: replicative DNA helicase [Methylomirabilota bacterium]|jgi:replicative DNA helicase|nr:replicative DNA helicase [Methylomirabilota bacterium]
MATLVELPGKVPPHNLEAERAVLGAILLEPAVLPRAIELLGPDEFYKDGHRKIYAAMVRLFDRSEPADVLTVSEELRRAGELEEVGGQAALATLMEEATVATQFSSYAQIVRDKAQLRELIRVAREMTEQGFEETEDVQSLLDRAEQMLFRIAERRLHKAAIPVRDVLGPAIRHIETLYHRKEDITGLPTGFKDLDKLTAGFQRSDFIIIAGRPSMGKTAFALNIAQHVAVKLRRPILFFSLEMSKEQLVQRLICAEARVDSHLVRTGHLTDPHWRRIVGAGGQLAEAPLLIDDTANLSVLEARAKARRVRAEHGLELVVIDYLQLMQGRWRAENRQQEISEISRSLKALAKELEVPVIALSQLSRAIEARGESSPRLSDLRESGALEQDADVIIFLHRSGLYKENAAEAERNLTDVIIGKQRNGPTDKIPLVFKPEYTRFEEMTPREQL